MLAADTKAINKWLCPCTEANKTQVAECFQRALNDQFVESHWFEWSSFASGGCEFFCALASLPPVIRQAPIEYWRCPFFRQPRTHIHGWPSQRNHGCTRGHPAENSLANHESIFYL